jgi:molecular chaperone DnaJ
LPRVNASGVGDLNVRVQMWTPQEMSSDEQALVRQLATLGAKPPASREKGFWSKVKDALGA